jgi:hypothetical protein
MNSSLYAKGNPIYPDTTTDLSAAIGKLVTFAAGIPSVSASATVPAVGIVLDARTRTTGSVTTYDNSIGILASLPAPVRVQLSAASAALAFGDQLMQAADGTVTKNITGSARVVVGVCTDKNGANPGDLFEAVLCDPGYVTF